MADAPIIKDPHWRNRAGRYELHFELNGKAAFCLTDQKRKFLEAGVVAVSPTDEWLEVLGELEVAAMPKRDIPVPATVTAGIESNVLALELLELIDAMEAGAVEQSPKYRGDAPER